MIAEALSRSPQPQVCSEPAGNDRLSNPLSATEELVSNVNPLTFSRPTESEPLSRNSYQDFITPGGTGPRCW